MKAAIKISLTYHIERCEMSYWEDVVRTQFLMTHLQINAIADRTSVSSFAILSDRTRYAHARFSRRTRWSVGI